MKIEFRSIGDGTNVEVSLLEILGGMEVVKDRFYTQDHYLEIAGIFQNPVLVEEVSFLFAVMEEILNPPIIGGEMGRLHPYWNERQEVRKRRLQNLESKEVACLQPTKR